MDKKIVMIIGGITVLIIVAGVVLASSKKQTNVVSNQRQVVDMKVTDSDAVAGKIDAPITLVEYADFQCPACGAYFPIVEKLLTDYPEYLRVIYRHYPLTNIHDKAYDAAVAAEAAGKQGKFWEMAKMLFAKQNEWVADTNYKARFEDYAKAIGVDTASYIKDVKDVSTAQRVQDGLASGNEFRITGTPTYYLNGILLDLPGSYENFKSLIEEEVKKLSEKK